MSHVISERAMQVAYEEIESLRQRLEMAEACLAGDNALVVGLKNDIAEKDAEITRRVTVDEMNAEIECATKAVAVYYENMLAASQARERQLRGNVRLVCGPVMDAFTDGQRWNDYQEIIDQSQDTTALQAMIAKAGEVMRERCLEDIWYMPKPQEIAIRALPPIALKDLE